MCDYFTRKENAERFNSIAYDPNTISEDDSDLRALIKLMYVKCYMALNDLSRVKRDTVEKDDVAKFIQEMVYMIDNINYDYGMVIDTVSPSPQISPKVSSEHTVYSPESPMSP